MAQITKLPKFPKDDLGLRRGTRLRVSDQLIAKRIGIPFGETFCIGYDGKLIRSDNVIFDMRSLVAAVKSGFLEIIDHVDLSNPYVSMHFAVLTERLVFVPHGIF